MPHFPKPAEGSWTQHYPHLGTGPISFEDSITPESYALERKAIFERTWLNVARVEQLPKKGWNTLFYFEPEPSVDHLRRMMRIGDKELPLVWTHQSGRQSLVLGCTARHIVDMDYRRSAELLVGLRDRATQPKFVYRHQWSVGDLVIWDNTGTMHRAMPYNPDSGRLLTRTKLAGEEPFA